MAAIEPVGGDRWRVRVDLGPHPMTGRRRQKSRTFTASGKKAATRKGSKIARELEAVAGKMGDHDGTVESILEDWLAVKKRSLSPRTIGSYRMWADRAITALGGIDAEDLTGAHVDRWYSALASEKVKPRSIDHAHAVLHSALRWARKNRGLATVATEHATPPGQQPAGVNVDQAATRRVLRALPREPWRQSSRAILLLALSGMRRGEAVGLRLADIEVDRVKVRHSIVEVKGGKVEVRPPKGKRERWVLLDAAAAAVVAEQVEYLAAEGIKTPWLFPFRRDWSEPARPNWLTQAWTRQRKKHKADHVRLHDLRHHWATLSLEDGAPLHAVQRQLGHALASTTADIYGHATDEGQRAAVDSTGARIMGGG